MPARTQVLRRVSILFMSYLDRPYNPLLLAGAHHRGGSEMLTRMLGALCKAVYGVKRWKKSSSDGPCLIDAETASAQGGYNVTSLLKLHKRGVKLFSSGRWSIPPEDMAIEPYFPQWRLIHIVRPPLELIVSSYLYHLHTDEEWAARVIDPPWATRMSLSPPIPRGLTYQQHLQSLNHTAGVILQAQHSLRLIASMVATAEQCMLMPPPHSADSSEPDLSLYPLSPRVCVNLWLGGFLHNFDKTVTKMLIGLGVSRGSDGSYNHLLPALKRAGHLTEEQAKKSSHVTRGKDDETRQRLIETLRYSEHGPILHRLEARLELAMKAIEGKVAEQQGKERPKCAWSSLGKEATNKFKGKAGGWWDSGEPTRLVKGPSRDLTPIACCEVCRDQVDPGCVYFNWRRISGNGENGTARCTMLTSRRSFHASRKAVTGEV